MIYLTPIFIILPLLRVFIRFLFYFPFFHTFNSGNFVVQIFLIDRLLFFIFPSFTIIQVILIFTILPPLLSYFPFIIIISIILIFIIFSLISLFIIILTLAFFSSFQHSSLIVLTLPSSSLSLQLSTSSSYSHSYRNFVLALVFLVYNLLFPLIYHFLFLVFIIFSLFIPLLIQFFSYSRLYRIPIFVLVFLVILSIFLNTSCLFLLIIIFLSFCSS